jgi:hypothetical protein
MELENIILSKVSHAQKTKNHMFSLLYKSRTNAVILLTWVTHEGENAHGRNRERERNLKLECS